jgi:hypothetical protein
MRFCRMGCWQLACPAAALTFSFAVAQAASAEMAIIWVVDGISYQAPERVRLKNLQSLMAQGVYYRQNYTVQTADPSNQPGMWAEYHTSSIPNPVLLAGTALLLPGKQHYVQESFFPLKITAHAVNEISYRALNVGFHFTAQAGGQRMIQAGHQTGDDRTLYWATQFLRVAKPAFMLIHMQDTGFAGSASRNAPAGSPYKDNIWGAGSPYMKTISQQDEYLGQFIDELKKVGVWDKTLIFITGDHGQTTSGWHPPEAQDAWAMPLVIAGPGIKKAQRFEYAESIDVVPTLCYLMGVRPPINSDGRVLAEALVDPPKDVAPRQQKIKELDYLLLDVQNAIEKLKRAGIAPAAGRGNRQSSSPVAEAERDFYRIERILEWHQFGTYDRLIAHHKQLLQRLISSTASAEAN